MQSAKNEVEHVPKGDAILFNALYHISYGTGRIAASTKLGALRMLLSTFTQILFKICPIGRGYDFETKILYSIIVAKM